MKFWTRWQGKVTMFFSNVHDVVARLESIPFSTGFSDLPGFSASSHEFKKLLRRVEDISESISVSKRNKVTQRLNAITGFSELPPVVKLEVWTRMQMDELFREADWSPKAMKQVIRMALEKFDN